MKKYLGLAVLFAGAAVVAAPGTASATRPDHSTRTHRAASQENAPAPDFSRTSSSAKGRRKPAPGSSAKGKEHKAEEGEGKSNAKPSAKTPHKAAPRRHGHVQPDDDYEPITIKRAHTERTAPSSATERHRLAEREPSPADRAHEHAQEHERLEARERLDARESSAHAQVATRESTEPRELPHRAQPSSGEERAASAHVLSTDDFLRAARGETEPSEEPAEPVEHSAAHPAARSTRASAAIPYATGIAHPPAGEVTVASAEPAPLRTVASASTREAASAPTRETAPVSSRPVAVAPAYIDERQVAEAQRIAIGSALRPQAIASETQPPATIASLPSAAPTRSAFESTPESEARPQAPAPVAVSLATVSAPPSERSRIASRTVEGDEAANRAPEDAVRSSSLGALSRQEMAAAAIAPTLPGLYSREGRLIVPAPLKGSHEVLVHQNEMADAAGLTRIRNDRELDKLREERRLIDFPEGDGLRVNPELPERRRCARPWTVAFAEQMARAYYAEFHEPFTISSAVRTMAYQVRLQRVNGNAAAIRGEGASPHLTGQAFDIGKTGLTLAQIAWLRTYLGPMIDAGRIDVEEEFQQACFHISVYPSATTHRTRTQQLAEMQ